MAEILNASLIFKDKDGNIGHLKALSANDIVKIQAARDHVAKVVNQTTGEVIAATTSSLGAVQLASDDDVTNAVVGKVVDAKQLAAVKAKLSTVYKYVGTVANYEALPTKDVLNGDVYNVEAAHGDFPAGTNYAAIVSDAGAITWDALGGSIDTSDFAQKSQANTFSGANTFTGTVVVPTPTADSQASTKKYVDDAIADIESQLPDVVKYASTEPSDTSAIEGNTVTFFPSSDLLK